MKTITATFPREALPGLEALWAETLGDPAIRIAVLDGPAELAHPCFAGARLEKLPTLVPETGPSDHGTHVASLIFGQPGSEIAGIAPGCHGLILPVFTQTPEGALKPCSQTDLARALSQAIEAGAQVVNISGGELTSSGQAVDFLANAVRQAAERNVLVVSAVGNDGCECLHVPAALPTVLAVGALDADGRPLGTSNFGSGLAGGGIMAPGALLSGAVTGGRVAPLTGTSFATPLVSGVAALLLSLQKKYGLAVDPAAVREALVRSAHPCDPRTVADCRRLLGGILNLPGARDLVIGSAGAKAARNRGLPAALSTRPGSALSSATDQPFEPFKGADMTESIESGIYPRDDRSGEPASPAFGCGRSEPSAARPAADDLLPITDLEPETDEIPADLSPSSVARAAPGPALWPSSPPLLSPPLPSPVIGRVSRVAPSCGGMETFSPFPPGQKIFVIGRLNFDFGTEARRDYFVAQIRAQFESEGRGGEFNPGVVFNPVVMADYLLPKSTSRALPGTATGSEPNNIDAANGLIWTIWIDQDPVYAIIPKDQYAVVSFVRLVDFLRDQVDSTDPQTFRVSMAGTVEGSITLLNGTVVPTVAAVARGMFDWDIEALLRELGGKPPVTTPGAPAPAAATPGEPSVDPVDVDLRNLLLRLYFQLRNLGVVSEDRARNFAATNAFQARKAFVFANQNGLKLDTISVKRSPICRRNSDCWDIGLTFFDPKNLFQVARTVYEYTIDVSDIIPVQVSDARIFQIFGGPAMQ